MVIQPNVKCERQDESNFFGEAKQFKRRTIQKQFGGHVERKIQCWHKYPTSTYSEFYLQNDASVPKLQVQLCNREALRNINNLKEFDFSKSPRMATKTASIEVTSKQNTQL